MEQINEKEILSKKERFENIIYMIFKYTLYIISFTFLYIHIGYLYTVLLICIFAFLAHAYYYNSQKVKEHIIKIALQRFQKEKCNELK